MIETMHSIALERAGDSRSRKCYIAFWVPVQTSCALEWGSSFWRVCAQVIQDLQEECSKYGRVLRVLVPRPPNPAASKELFGSNNYGKVRRQTPPASPSVLPAPGAEGCLFSQAECHIDEACWRRL